MQSTKIKPTSYEGTGSAIDDYFKPKAQGSQPQAQNPQNWGFFDKDNPQHKRIQANLRTAKIVTPQGYADMLGWFNRFLKSNKSPVKKPLKQMTPDEVSKIIVALDGVAVWKNQI